MTKELYPMEQRCWRAGVSADAAKGRAGNPAFEQSQQYLFDRLAAAGLSPRFETFADSSTGWEQVTGTLRLGGPAGEVVLSRDRHRVALAINSVSTPAGGTSFKLVDAGTGTSAAAYEGKDVRGAVVLASGSLGGAWQQAVRNRGAALARRTRSCGWMRFAAASSGSRTTPKTPSACW